ncbi:MAG: hypothetical protein WDM92_13745 [Caulobacteraceae bacterium]
MFKLLRSPEAAQCGSAMLVFITAAIIGHEAAVGMNPIQWAWATVSVLGSISVAVMVHVWPERAKASANPRDRRG